MYFCDSSYIFKDFRFPNVCNSWINFDMLRLVSFIWADNHKTEYLVHEWRTFAPVPIVVVDPFIFRMPTISSLYRSVTSFLYSHCSGLIMLNTNLATFPLSPYLSSNQIDSLKIPIFPDLPTCIRPSRHSTDPLFKIPSSRISSLNLQLCSENL